MKPGYWGILLLALTACAGNEQIEEVGITDDDGVIEDCGEGPGLDPCLDYTGRSFDSEESSGPMPGEDDQQLEEEAAEMRKAAQ